MTQYGDSGSPSRSREYTIERSGGCSERRHHGRAVTLSRTARMEGRFAVLPQVRQVGPEVPSMAPVAGPLPNRGERHERLRGLLPPASDDEHALRKEVNSSRDDGDDAGRLPIHGTPHMNPNARPPWKTTSVAVYASTVWYPNMKSGHFHEPDSRRTTANVLIHWQASTKNTISDTPVSGVMSFEPSSRVADRKADRSGWFCSSASLMSNTIPIVDTNTSRAANAPRMPTPIRQSNPSGAMRGSMRWPTRPATLCRNCSPRCWPARVSSACVRAVPGTLDSIRARSLEK